ncbi:MHYT domain-containing protein, NO-binding membrane sensor [Promicromonospora umidemergens]|uniref:MHYT domain-containing protein n=1 Tax=Promicromonospora umidemergens TaxID=629679 RepID=A0ABP8WHS9_9MICO|nr:MHYT domain-containing protein [Promicromonospora umidemergens]MCP2286904.1 MHYT domain-containing protein, NO-binding membrane sensor [Promicromonospora umidemergens]
MPVIDHFTFGIVTPLLAYAISCTGAATGLACTSRARAASGGTRAAWLVFGAIALGGTGIWVMHFVAMLGFSASGVAIRYDIPQTLLSAAIAIVVVGAGLFITELGKRKLPAMLVGGALAGAGVAAMHYMGMEAMEMSAEVVYNPAFVVASILIAIVAATAALWCTVHIRGMLATIVATLVMGLAVTGMHYTGMAGVSVINPIDSVPAGASTMQLLVPLVMAVSVVTFLLILGIGLWPTEEELRTQAEFENRLKAHSEQGQQFENVRQEPQPGPAQFAQTHRAH